MMNDLMMKEADSTRIVRWGQARGLLPEVVIDRSKV